MSTLAEALRRLALVVAVGWAVLWVFAAAATSQALWLIVATASLLYFPVRWILDAFTEK